MASSLVENHCSGDYKTLLVFTVHVTTMSWFMCLMYFTVYIYIIDHIQVYVVCLLNHQVVSDSCNPMDCSSPGPSVHGILRVLIQMHMYEETETWWHKLTSSRSRAAANIAAHWWGSPGRENCLPSTLVPQLKRYPASYFINQTSSPTRGMINKMEKLQEWKAADLAWSLNSIPKHLLKCLVHFLG